MWQGGGTYPQHACKCSYLGKGQQDLPLKQWARLIVGCPLILPVVYSIMSCYKAPFRTQGKGAEVQHTLLLVPASLQDKSVSSAQATRTAEQKGQFCDTAIPF